jgi:hypothetical protein
MPVAYLAVVNDGVLVLKPYEVVPTEVTHHVGMTKKEAIAKLLARQRAKLREFSRMASQIQGEHRIALRGIRRHENEELEACIG